MQSLLALGKGRRNLAIVFVVNRRVSVTLFTSMQSVLVLQTSSGFNVGEKRHGIVAIYLFERCRK